MLFLKRRDAMFHSFFRKRRDIKIKCFFGLGYSKENRSILIIRTILECACLFVLGFNRNWNA
jgi:hypothetical protein